MLPNLLNLPAPSAEALGGPVGCAQPDILSSIGHQSETNQVTGTPAPESVIVLTCTTPKYMSGCVTPIMFLGKQLYPGAASVSHMLRLCKRPADRLGASLSVGKTVSGPALTTHPRVSGSGCGSRLVRTWAQCDVAVALGRASGQMVGTECIWSGVMHCY